MIRLQHAGAAASPEGGRVISSAAFMLLIGLALTLMLLPTAALGDLLVYEGFDYPEGNLGGQNGGLGFASAWTTGGTVVAGSLSYIDGNSNELPTTGNHALLSAASASVSAYRDLTRRYGTDATYGPGVYWASFIGERLEPHPTLDENSIRSFALQFHSGTGTSGNERLDVGKVTTVSPVMYNWALFSHGELARSVETSTSMFDLSFFVVEITIADSTDGNQSDSARMWVNPNLDEPLGTPDAAVSGATGYDYLLQRVRLWAGNTNADGPYAEWVVDEIRFGTTLLDVVGNLPIPGDTDGDGIIELADDLDPIRMNYLNNVTSRAEGDLTGDLFVNFADFRQWKTAYLGGGGSLAGVNLGFLTVPEPTSLVLCGLALAAGFAIGRRRRA